jgi:hypothetical protein
MKRRQRGRKSADVPKSMTALLASINSAPSVAYSRESVFES